jgi:hypothetical protein
MHMPMACTCSQMHQAQGEQTISRRSYTATRNIGSNHNADHYHGVHQEGFLHICVLVYVALLLQLYVQHACQSDLSTKCTYAARLDVRV